MGSMKTIISNSLTTTASNSSSQEVIKINPSNTYDSYSQNIESIYDKQFKQLQNYNAPRSTLVYHHLCKQKQWNYLHLFFIYLVNIYHNFKTIT